MASKALIILSEARSGSNWLTSLMAANKGWGNPREWLNPAVHRLPRRDRISAEPLLQKIAKDAVSPKTGVLGMKVFTHQLMRFHQLYGFDPLQRLTETRDTLFLRLERRDRVAQAVSLEIARQSGAWKSTSSRKSDPAYDFNRLLRAYFKIETSQAFWDSYCTLRKLENRVFVYEDLCDDPTPWLRACAEFTGHPLAKGAPKATSLLPQRDGRNAEWAARFEADLAGADVLQGLYPSPLSLPRRAVGMMLPRPAVRQFDL